MVRVALVPAAGLGTRLLPATLATPKELLPLGGQPVLVHVLLEARAAGLEELVVVVSPGKDALRRLLDPARWGELAEHPAVVPLARLLGSLRVRIVEQPAALGALDAIERGRRAAGGGPAAVLYPDLVHLPDQRGLAALLAAHERAAGGAAVLGLRRAAGADLHGPSVVVELEPAGAGAEDGPRRITRVCAPTAPAAPGELRSTFGLVESPAYLAALDRLARDDGGLLDDSRYVAALGALAEEGGLLGAVLPGEVLDVGHPAGYHDATVRFATGRARWSFPG